MIYIFWAILIIFILVSLFMLKRRDKWWAEYKQRHQPQCTCESHMEMINNLDCPVHGIGGARPETPWERR
jgi:hypothetical protein